MGLSCCFLCFFLFSYFFCFFWFSWFWFTCCRNLPNDSVGICQTGGSCGWGSMPTVPGCTTEMTDGNHFREVPCFWRNIGNMVNIAIFFDIGWKSFFWRNVFIRKYNSPWSVAVFLLRIFLLALFKMAASIGNCIHVWIFFGNELLHYKTQYPLKCCSIPFEKYVSLQIVISLEILQHYFWETHAFFKMPFFTEITLIFEACLAKKSLLQNTTPWSAAALFLDLLKNTCRVHPFSICLLQVGNAEMHYCLK